MWYSYQTKNKEKHSLIVVDHLTATLAPDGLFFVPLHIQSLSPSKNILIKDETLVQEKMLDNPILQ